MKTVIRHLRAAALCCKGEGPTDGQLLESFIVRREETAFEALVRRHGPMVFGVCRRVLRNVHDAEDAFQATFLVLARKAVSVKPREMVGNWLYGVAYRTAMKARAMNAKRREKELYAGTIPHSEASTGVADEALLEQLDHELNRLPDKYRVPVVLCELEGRSRKEAAGMLGMPEGTLSWRLAQAKKILAERLSRRGAILSVGAVIAAMTETLSPALRASTVKTVFSVNSVPSQVLTLTEGVMKAMLLSKLKITICAAMIMVVAGIGATGLTYRATAQQPGLASRPQTDELEALRLEIEALRKSLQATRDRVKTLEGEVSALKGQSGVPAHSMPGASPRGQGGPSGAKDVPADAAGGLYGMPKGDSGIQPSSGPKVPAPGGGAPKGMQNQMMPQMQHQRYGSKGGTDPNLMRKHRDQGMGGMKEKEPSDPLSDAEAALKKLRENPGDTKATEELERALKKLRSVLSETTPPAK